MPSFNAYGQMTNQPPQPGPQTYQPWQDAKAGHKNFTGGAYGSGVNAQSQKDMAAFGALQNLGVAGQNAMGQYGMAQQNALVNSQIAQANALGQLGSQYYNTMGQLGQANAGMAAAASQAGADTNKASALGGLASGMINAQMYNAQMAPYTAGNMPNFNFGGGGLRGGMGGGGRRGGFKASGPEGRIASGRMGGLMAGGGPDDPTAGFIDHNRWLNGTGPGGASSDGDAFRPDLGRPTAPSGGGRGFNQPPAPPYVSGGNSQTYNPYEPFRTASGTLQGMLGDMRNPRSMPGLIRNDMMNAFGSTQKNIMDPGVMNSLNGQMAMGYGALGNIYGQSDYGFNTGRPSFNPRYNAPNNASGFMH